MPKSAPGLLRGEMDPDVVLMLCTAGHVDHGKTALVTLLTGCNTDRLKIEQERGMTIELGFAPCYLGGNLCVGIVDVPGHEKFVRTMVAGVSGIDMAIVVIAADDGIMPQTIEHFQILELLGVRKGVVALTKIDLVSAERRREVTDEIRTFLAGTFLDDAPICPVSSVTFEGYDEFYETLVARIRALGKTKRGGVFRMPIERTFTRQGYGTIVTGIPVGGTVRIGDEVEVVPDGGRGKVRGIQRFLRDASEGGFGQCLALNIPELTKRTPERGEVVCAPGYLKASRSFQVWLKTVPGLAKPLQHAEAIKFHTGTSEANGKVYLLEGKELGGGGTALASVVVSEEIPATAHDRFILRRLSPAVTAGGGEILAVAGAEEREKRALIVERLQAYRSWLGAVDPLSDEGVRKRIEFLLRTERPFGVSVSEAAMSVSVSDGTARECLDGLVSGGAVLRLSGGATVRVAAVGTAGSGNGVAPRPTDTAHYIHADSHRHHLETITARVGKAASEGAVSVAVSDLRGAEEWPEPLWDRMMEDLRRAGQGEVRGNRFVLGGGEERFSPAERAALSRLERIYEESGFKSPRPEEASVALRLPVGQFDRLFEHLCTEGRLVRLSPQVILSRAHFAKAQRMVVEAIQKDGVLDSADFKNYIESSRKYALAILDYLDTRRVTIRVGNLRKLAPDYQRNLL